MKTNNLQLIERYFNQQMDEIEKLDFERRLEDEPLLNREFEEYRAIYDAIGDKETLELRKQLKKIGEEFSEKRHKKDRDNRNPNLNSWFWMAALFIVSLGLVAITYMLVSSSVTRQAIGMRIGIYNVENHIYTLEPAYAESVRFRVRSEDFHLEIPRDSLVVERRHDIVYRWNTTNPGPITLDVMNRFGKIIYSSSTNLHSPFVLKKNLAKGIYVYRFRTDKTTLYTGLFYVV